MSGPAYWTFGLPIALTERLQVLVDRVPCRELRRPLFLFASGLVGAAGLRLVRAHIRSPWLRPLAWMLAWHLCLLGLLWLVFATFAARRIPFLFVIPPVLGAALRRAFALRADPGWQRLGFRLATGFIGPLGYRLFFEPIARWWLWLPTRVVGWVMLCIGAAWFVAVGWAALLAIPVVRYCLLAFPVACLDVIEQLMRAVDPSGGTRRYFPLATAWVGARGLHLYRKPPPQRWLRSPARCCAWILCLVGLIWFLAAGWLTLLRAARFRYITLCLPIALVNLLEQLFRKLAGEDWHQAGFGIATAFLGPAALWLYRRPRRWWLRVLAWAAAMVLSVAGLAWFAYCGKFALLLIPLLRQGKHLRAAPLYPPEPDWVGRPLRVRVGGFDYLSLSIIGVVAGLLLVGHQGLKPFAPDAYYHLLISQRIVESGEVPLWDWWEYAPAGRPHLYPPLLHLLIALFSLPLGKDVVEGLQVLQVFMLPFAYLATWYLARWLFDGRRAFLAVLILGADFMFPLFGLMGLPSILANCLLPLLLVMFLSKRFWGAAGLMALTLYAHMGIGALAVLGLLIFAVWNRAYLKFFLRTAATGIVLSLPWYAHVWMYRSWIGHPMRGHLGVLPGALFKLFWLLMLNVVILLLAARGMRLVRWNDLRNRLLVSNLAGFIPMLISYGGRFFAHTVQVWALFAAVPLAPLLTGRYRRQMIAVLLLLAACPTLLLSGFSDKGKPPRIHPWLSGWVLMPVVALAGEGVMSGDGKQANAPTPEILELADYIQRRTTPDQILHVFNDASLGVMLGFHAKRRIDTAAWPEVRQAKTMEAVANYAQTDPTGCYISRTADAIPEDIELTQVGGFYVGIRARVP